MKLIFSISIMLLSWTTAMSQEAVFEKQFEKARFNESRGISAMVETLIKTDLVSNDAWMTMVAVISEKEGIISVTKANTGLIVKYENWMALKDIIDILEAGGIVVLHDPSESNETID